MVTYFAFNPSSELRILNQRLQRSQSLGAADDDILEAGHLRHTEEKKRIYAQRKETIERGLADLKEQHDIR
ncbi:hypothetical protein J27TS7_15710 [Paenibacillus dendritiformis]|nr:hypothetical protein [Paenibacillus dendritiformis]GIO72057.1 hypothetical protein J27TS7_15710 [Paenibacillus dendritiformis]